jgi:drug/metabolite transporter (DMT)-like permease
MFAIGETLALLSAFLWGNSGVLLKSLPNNKRISFIFLESIISGIVILILISTLNQWKEFAEFTYITVFFAILAASINLAGSVFYIYTIKHVKVGMGFVIINSLFPLFSIIGSIFFLGDKLSLPIYLGAVFILIGISIIAIKRDPSFSFLEEGSVMKVAIIFCTLTPLSWATGALIMDRLLDNHAVLPLVFIRAINTFIICIVLSVLIKKVSFKIQRSEKRLIFASFLTTGAMLGWFTSLSLSEAALVVILGSSAPIFALLGGWLFLKEKINLAGFAGIVSCLIGVLIVIL